MLQGVLLKENDPTVGWGGVMRHVVKHSYYHHREVVIYYRSITERRVVVYFSHTTVICQ